MTCFFFCPNWLQQQQQHQRPKLDGEQGDTDDDDSDDAADSYDKKIVFPAVKVRKTKEGVAAPLPPSLPSRRKGSVANAIANIEKKNKDKSKDKAYTTTTAPKHMSGRPIKHKKKQSSKEAEEHPPPSLVTVLAKASTILDRFCHPPTTRLEDDSAKPRSFRVAPAPDNTIRQCRICQKKLFPTDQITTAQKHEYHVGCFKCTLCGTKLKNHPEEDHDMASPRPPVDKKYKSSSSSSSSLYSSEDDLVITLKCPQCKIDKEQIYESRIQSTLAGQRVVIGDEEQGDIEQVVDLIGDELEDAILCGMTPRCSTCGGDFLTYSTGRGEIVMVGALKYHKECWQMGKPAAALCGGGGSSTGGAILPPRQAAKYLPDTLILRLSSTSSSPSSSSGDDDNNNNNAAKIILSTLFFVWTNNKDDQLKALRTNTTTNGNDDNNGGGVRLFFELDKEARANPNHPSNVSSKKKRFIDIPPPRQQQQQQQQQDSQQQQQHPSLQVDIINEQIAPRLPRAVGDSQIVLSSSHNNNNKEISSSALSAQVAYDMYNLRHLITLTVPCCDSEPQRKLDLAKAALTVDIHPIIQDG